MDIDAIAGLAPVIPVLTVDGPDDGVPLARAMVKGGLRALEVTLRTAGAIEALRAMAREVPDAVLGAGTVLNPSQLDAMPERRERGSLSALAARLSSPRR